MNRTQNQFVVNLEKRKIGGLGFVVKKKPGSTSAVVTDIVKGSVAQENGLLQVGDVILEINGTQATELTFDQVLETLNGVPVGKEVTLKVQAASSVTQSLQSKSEAAEHLNGSLVNGGIMNGNDETNQTQNACPYPGYKNRKFVRLTNLITGKQITDTLHQKAMEVRPLSHYFKTTGKSQKKKLCFLLLVIKAIPNPIIMFTYEPLRSYPILIMLPVQCGEIYLGLFCFVIRMNTHTRKVLTIYKGLTWL